MIVRPLPESRSDRALRASFLSRGALREGRAVERRDGDRVRDSQLATVLAFALTLGLLLWLPKIRSPSDAGGPPMSLVWSLD